VQKPLTESLHSCPICLSPRIEPVSVPRRWVGENRAFEDLRGLIGITRCKRCDFAFTNPRPVADVLSAFYDGPSYECHTLDGSAVSGRNSEFIISTLLRHAGRTNGRLLDFGCGSGAFPMAAREAGLEICGYEPGERGRECCERLGIEVAATLDAIPGRAFDFVVLHHVLEHLQDPVGILSHLRSLLSYQGCLFVEVPNLKSLRARLATDFVRRLWADVDERYRAFPIHLMYYSKASLMTVLKDAGYHVETLSTIGLGLDEFLFEGSSQNRMSVSAASPHTSQVKLWKSIKRQLRDTFLGFGLGENLFAIARSGSVAR
jgi:SAM-dependent methyltransferase